MKAKNMPGRKNIRRMAALDRMIASPPKRNRFESEGSFALRTSVYLRTCGNKKDKIIDQTQAEAIRTKKDRQKA